MSTGYFFYKACLIELFSNSSLKKFTLEFNGSVAYGDIQKMEHHAIRKSIFRFVELYCNGYKISITEVDKNIIKKIKDMQHETRFDTLEENASDNKTAETTKRTGLWGDICNACESGDFEREFAGEFEISDFEFNVNDNCIQLLATRNDCKIEISIDDDSAFIVPTDDSDDIEDEDVRALVDIVDLNNLYGFIHERTAKHANGHKKQD